MRLDQALTERGLASSRSRAQAAVLAGLVFVNGERVTKAGHDVEADDALRVEAPAHPWASRGGVKLEGALRALGLSPEGLVCLDAGASTGGFTDVLLTFGAARVHAVDVGYGLIDWRLRNDPRVVLHERQNVRYVTPEILGETVDFVTLDLSFIGLEKVFGAVEATLGPNWQVVLALVKPQFQVGKGKVGRGGVVRDPRLHLEAMEAVARAGQERGWHLTGATPSPIRGPEGNVEFWLALTPGPGGTEVDLGSVAAAGALTRKGP